MVVRRPELLSGLALVLAAAALHATWNVLLALARDEVSVVLFAPVARSRGHVEAGALPCIGLSAALELA